MRQKTRMGTKHEDTAQPQERKETRKQEHEMPGGIDRQRSVLRNRRNLFTQISLGLLSDAFIRTNQNLHNFLFFPAPCQEACNYKVFLQLSSDLQSKNVEFSFLGQ